MGLNRCTFRRSNGTRLQTIKTDFVYGEALGGLAENATIAAPRPPKFKMSRLISEDERRLYLQAARPSESK